MIYLGILCLMLFSYFVGRIHESKRFFQGLEEMKKEILKEILLGRIK